MSCAVSVIRLSSKQEQFYIRGKVSVELSHCSGQRKKVNILYRLVDGFYCIQVGLGLSLVKQINLNYTNMLALQFFLSSASIRLYCMYG